MELKHDSIIVSDRLQALFDFELKNYFTHVFVTDGECAMKYSGEEVRMEKGDCVIIIANRLCVTPAYLSETCKSISGSGAAYWINRYTSVEIARLLRDRSLTLTDIAYRFDFSSTAHLSRYIRQNLGISASEIRGGEK
jgi:AraC-like DNA-binding protein